MFFYDFLVLKKASDPFAQHLLSMMTTGETSLGQWEVRRSYNSYLNELNVDEAFRQEARSLFAGFLKWEAKCNVAEQADPLCRDGLWRRFMPYCFKKLMGYPKHVWLPLNRNYKPLGVVSSRWVDYYDYSHQAIVFERDPTKFRGIWLYTRDPDMRWLYNDDAWPAADYYARLAKLQRKKQRSVEPGDVARWREQQRLAALRRVRDQLGREKVAEVLVGFGVSRADGRHLSIMAGHLRGKHDELIDTCERLLEMPDAGAGETKAVAQ